MQKNIINTALVALAIVSITSCKKFITKNPVGVYPESEFYTTQAQAILAINASYAPLAFTTSNNNKLWVFGDVASDDAVKGGNPGDEADIDFIDQFNVNAANGILASKWALLYDGITRCNLVLNKVPAIQMDKTMQARILGEAKFLRAFYYFELVRIYGDVPVILQPLTAEQLQIAPISPRNRFMKELLKQTLKVLYPIFRQATAALMWGVLPQGQPLHCLQKFICFKINGIALPQKRTL